MKFHFNVFAELKFGAKLKQFIESATLKVKLFFSGGRKDEK